MIVVVRDSLLDLGKLGLDPCIVNVPVRVEPRECPKAVLLVPMVDEPARALREDQNQRDEDHGGNDLDPEGNWSPLSAQVSQLRG